MRDNCEELEDVEISPEMDIIGQEMAKITEQYNALAKQYKEQNQHFQEMIKQRRENEKGSPEYIEADEWLLDRKRKKEERKVHDELLKTRYKLLDVYYKCWFQAAYEVCGDELFSCMNKQEKTKIKKLLKTAIN